MPTGQQIVSNALLSLGLLDAGGSPSASESTDLLQELNTQVDAWGTDELLIPSITKTQFALTANQASYTYGTGGNFNAARPVRVDQAVFVATVGAGTTRKPLRIVGSTEMFAHADSAAAATSAEQVYFDYANAAGLMKAYFYPVPSCPTASFAEFETWTPIAAFALATNVTLPPGYQDALQQSLAFRCLSRYGSAVSQATAQVVADLAKSAKARIMKLNQENRVLPRELLADAQQQGAPPPQAAR